MADAQVLGEFKKLGLLELGLHEVEWCGWKIPINDELDSYIVLLSGVGKLKADFGFEVLFCPMRSLTIKENRNGDKKFTRCVDAT